MRRFHLFVVFATGLLVALPGSAAFSLTWELGLKGGVNIAQFLGRDTEALVTSSDEGERVRGNVDKTVTGLVAGASVAAKMSELFGIRVEALYSQKGSWSTARNEVTVDSLGTEVFDTDVTFEFDYVEIPILAVFTFPYRRDQLLSLFAGPDFAFNTRARRDIEFPDGSRTDSDFKEHVQSVDIGLILGGGISYPAGRFRITLDGRWTLGISKWDDSSDALDVKNSTFSLLLGIIR